MIRWSETLVVLKRKAESKLPFPLASGKQHPFDYMRVEQSSPGQGGVEETGWWLGRVLGCLLQPEAKFQVWVSQGSVSEPAGR